MSDAERAVPSPHDAESWPGPEDIKWWLSTSLAIVNDTPGSVEPFLAETELQFPQTIAPPVVISFWKRRGMSPRAAAVLALRASERAYRRLGDQAAKDFAAGNAASSPAIARIVEDIRSGHGLPAIGKWGVITPGQLSAAAAARYGLPPDALNYVIRRPAIHNRIVGSAGMRFVVSLALLIFVFLVPLPYAAREWARSAGDQALSALIVLFTLVCVFYLCQTAYVFMRPYASDRPAPAPRPRPTVVPMPRTSPAPAQVAAPPPVPAAPRRCAQCAEPVPEGDGFCSNCGAAMPGS